MNQILNQRVLLQEKTRTQTALGSTETWKPVSYYYARVIPLDVKTISAYQQLNTVVSHKILLRGNVTVELSKYRFRHGSKTYEPATSAKHLEDMTEILVLEV